jgi:hypothetical protein
MNLHYLLLSAVHNCERKGHLLRTTASAEGRSALAFP